MMILIVHVFEDEMEENMKAAIPLIAKATTVGLIPLVAMPGSFSQATELKTEEFSHSYSPLLSSASSGMAPHEKLLSQALQRQVISNSKSTCSVFVNFKLETMSSTDE